MTGPDRQPVSTAEIAALTARLRALSDAGRDADPRERAVFLAHRDALLDRITHPDNPDRHQRDDQRRGSGGEDQTMPTHDPARAGGGGTGYRLRRPGEAVDELAGALAGGRVDAAAMVGGYLAAMTTRYGEPAGGWRLDDDDLTEIAARYAWVDTAGGETLPDAQARAAAEGEALRDRAAVADRDGMTWTAQRIRAHAADWEQRAQPDTNAETQAGREPGVELSDDGWVSGGYEAAHQAHLDYLAEGGDRAADIAARWETEDGQARVGQWARETAEPGLPMSEGAGRVDRPEEIAARIQAIRDQIDDQALAEDTQHTYRSGPVEDAADDSDEGQGDTVAGPDDGDGWSR